MPLPIKLDLITSATDPIVSYLHGASLNGANTSVLWQVDKLQATCDACTSVNGLMNSDTDHLKHGSGSPWKCDTALAQT